MYKGVYYTLWHNTDYHKNGVPCFFFIKKTYNRTENGSDVLNNEILYYWAFKYTFSVEKKVW